MNRLATVRPDNRGALRIVLDHLSERSDGHEYTIRTTRSDDGKRYEHKDRTEYGAALDMLRDTAYGSVLIARALTDIARDDNLPIKAVDESAIRKSRDREGIK